MSALRRMRGGDDDGAHRNGELPYSDQPPAYDNLGYVGRWTKILALNLSQVAKFLSGSNLLSNKLLRNKLYLRK